MLTETETKLIDAMAKPTTARQTAVLKLFTDAGFTVKKTRMIGAKLWIEAERKWITEKNPNGHFMLDEDVYGCVGPRGKLELKFTGFMYTTEVTEPWHLRSRLERREGHKSPAVATEPPATV